MCGILAIVGHDLPAEDVAGTALDLMRHRGPDGRGLWRDDRAVLGCRRLAILDRSAAGDQPMVDAATGVALVFNGEIYNYLELRDRLVGLGHRFRSGCDTEVLLRAYLEWGEGCVDRFNGMWAFIVWDPRAGTAFFSRDRLGVKPFSYMLREGCLAVASEPKALLALYPEQRRVDERTLFQFLSEAHSYHGDHSFHAGIRVLEPGAMGTFEPGQSTPRFARYWDYPSAGDQLAADDCSDRFAELIEDAVRLRMRSDVPVGVMLSGGLDSTAILHGAQRRARTGSQLTAYTTVYRARPGDRTVDERQWAKLATAPYPAVDLVEVETAEDDWLAETCRIVWHMDGPSRFPVAFSAWRIAETARAQGIAVLLEGQGGDEILGGYPHHMAAAFLDGLERAMLRPILPNLRRLIDIGRTTARAVPTERILYRLAGEAFPALRQPYRRRVAALATLRPEFVRAMGGVRSETHRDSRDGSRFDQRHRFDCTRGILPETLHQGDAVAMAHSVETRHPFLDYRLVEFCLRLPPTAKIEGGETKRILREYLRRVGQDAIAARARKVGFPSVESTWLRRDGGALLRETLLARDARLHAFAEPDRIRRLLDHHARGRPGAGLHLYGLLATELWLRQS